MAREKFRSGRGFILASVGAAVGLGNSLRFPGLCAEYGGGAFLLIYFIALAFLGLPLLCAEIALGRMTGGAAPRCMASLRKRAAPLGWAAGANSLITSLIYIGLAGWILSMAVAIVPLSLSADGMTESEVSGYFFERVLFARNDGVIDGFSFYVAAGIACAAVFAFFCTRGGANALAKAAEVTVFLPVIFLSLMAVRGFFYPNSSKALASLFMPDFSALSSPKLWLTAIAQVFFSLSVAVGIMPAYGAYLPEGTNIFGCSLVIAAADFFVSVLAAVVLFCALYGCGLEGQIGQSAILTAFSVYPVVIVGLFGSNVVLNAIVGVTFYLSLSMTALQSAASMMEAFLSPLIIEFSLERRRAAAVTCAVGGAFSLLFAASAAPFILSVSDRFINFYNILALCIAECIVVGSSGKLKGLAAEINRFSRKLKMPAAPFCLSLKFFCPAVLTALAAMEIARLIGDGFNIPFWALFAFGLLPAAAVFVFGFVAEFAASRPRQMCLKDKKNDKLQKLS